MIRININRYILAGFLALSVGSLQAQQSKVTLKKADEAFASFNFPKAIGYYERYLQFFKKDKGAQPDARAYAQLARAHWNIRDYRNSERWLDSLPRQFLMSDLDLLRKRAELFAIRGQYDSARIILSGLPSFTKRAEGFRNVGQFQKDSSDWQLGYALVNTPDFNEFSPVIFNGRVMWSTNEPAFKSQHTVAGWDGKSMIRQAWVDDGLELELGGVPAPRANQQPSATKAKRLANTYALSENTLRSQGTIAPGSRSTVLNPNDLLREFIGLNRLDYNIGHASSCIATGRVYFSANEEGRVKNDAPRTLKVVEADVRGGMVVATRFLELSTADSIAMHPAIHPNGEVLVYSAMRRGRSDYDLYMSRRDSTGKWSAPQSLDALNTAGNEVFSTFDASGNLHFSSDGHPGLGGLDIYKAIGVDGVFTGFSHVSYPLNSSYDDFGWTEIPGSNGRGYLTSNRHGSDDIFGFGQQFYTTRITGAVVDINTGLRQPGVKVTVFLIEADGVTRRKVGEFVTDEKGNYSVDGLPDKYYEVRLSNTGDLKDDKMKDPQVHKVYSEKDKSWVSAPPLFVGKMKDAWVDAYRIPSKVGGGPIPGMDTLVVFEGGKLIPAGDMSDAGQKAAGTASIREFIINFDFDSANIDLRAEAIIQDLLGYLRTYPHARLMLMGHTDVEGSNEYNVALSERRSRRVKARLMELGYPASRIATSYYGELQPRIQTRNKAEARTNRRVEVYILR